VSAAGCTALLHTRVARFLLTIGGRQEALRSVATNDQPMGPQSILVVEDDDDTRDALCLLLIGQGYDVAHACNGREALQILRWARPALIITDLSMPVMNGWQLLDAVRGKKVMNHVPIIVLSADERSPSPDVCFLRKPVGAEHLLAEISSRVPSFSIH
jgi:CheY-like chemotaxis protein